MTGAEKGIVRAAVSRASRANPAGSRKTARAHTAAAALGLVLLSAGCSRPRADYGFLGLVDVRGAITLDGKPLVGATVIFEEPNHSFSSGVTDAAGHYRLMFNSEQAGVKPGRKTVRIRTRAGVSEEPDEVGPSRGGTPTILEKVPARYNAQSTLSVVVEAGTHKFDFTLTTQP